MDPLALKTMNLHLKLSTPAPTFGTFNQHHLDALDLLTPPSSEEREPLFELPLDSKADTPHRSLAKDALTLPRVFNRKCKITMPNCEPSSSRLTAIREEPSDDSSKILFPAVGNSLFSSEHQSSCPPGFGGFFSGALTPDESPRAKKRTFAVEATAHVPAVHTTPRKSESTIAKDALNVPLSNRLTSLQSPRKRVKPLKLGIKALVSADQKENSPIKIDLDSVSGGAWALPTYQPRHMVLKRPPTVLTLRALGKEKESVDILTSLAELNMYHVVQKITSFLDPVDLAAVERVSTSWRHVASFVFSQRDLRDARQMALTSKENLPVMSQPVSKKSANESTPRKLAVMDRNKLVSPKRRILQMPDLSPRTKRFRAFCEEGKSLSNPTEKLQPCPLCKYPARNCSESEAACSSCTFVFCVMCKCAPHPNSLCKYILSITSSPSPKKKSHRSIGTKASKKALRRLL